MAPLLSRIADKFGMSFGSSAPSDGALSATGGTILTPGNGYKYHVFSFPNISNFSVTSGSGSAEVLVVAGGGGGGNWNQGGNGGGGGGAGGIVYHSTYTIAPGTYPVTVGNGGSRNPSPNGSFVGANGGDSIFGGLTAKGGGGGGGYTDNGTTGGSGGGSGGAALGGAASQPGQTHPTAPLGWVNYGSPGGPNSGNPGRGSGGGGAAAAGGAGGGSNVGGNGIAFPQFAGPVIGFPTLLPAPQLGHFGGGGGGGGYPSGQPNTGGLGGGGGPNVPPGSAPIPGVNNTGGGGAAGTDGGVVAGNGGSGIVIIRYLA